MKKTGVYLRVSTEEQRERHTIATQRRAAERYLQTQHGVQVQWYEDNGVSGMIPLADRPAGGQLLHDAREGVIKPARKTPAFRHGDRRGVPFVADRVVGISSC